MTLSYTHVIRNFFPAYQLKTREGQDGQCLRNAMATANNYYFNLRHENLTSEILAGTAYEWWRRRRRRNSSSSRKKNRAEIVRMYIDVKTVSIYKVTARWICEYSSGKTQSEYKSMDGSFPIHFPCPERFGKHSAILGAHL